MATLTLKNVPREVHRSLARRAALHHRSLNREAIACLEESVRAHAVDPDALLARAQALREQTGPLGHAGLRAMKRSGRP